MSKGPKHSLCCQVDMTLCPPLSIQASQQGMQTPSAPGLGTLWPENTGPCQSSWQVIWKRDLSGRWVGSVPGMPQAVARPWT